MSLRIIRMMLFAVTFLSIICVTIMPKTAYAEINIAVVDIEKILSDSKAAKSIKDQVDKKRKTFLDQVKKEEDKLRADQKALEDKRADLSQEELVKKIQEFETQRIEARKKIQDTKGKLDNGYTEAMNTLTKSIFEVCQEIANEQTIDLVITRQNIIVGSNSLDITKTVMERLDTKLPSLTLNAK